MNRKRFYKCYIAIVVLGFILCIVYYHSKDVSSLKSIMRHIQGDAILFSRESGIYQESLSVSLKLAKGFPGTAEIYYTINGDAPTTHSKKYTDNIELKLTGNLKRYDLKAVIYYKGDLSRVFEKEYILCADTSNTYGLDTVYITTSPKNLYDYETGIFAKGKSYDEHKLEEDLVQEYVYGNYSQRGDEWIRNAHLIMFNADGDALINDDIGIGVSGGTSSAMPVKSLKIYVDEEYGSKNDKLCLDFRQDKFSYCSNVTEYNSLRLRSGSQDMDRGNIRSAVVSSLALNSNFDGCTESRRCIVYLNGRFYGIFDIQQNYSDSFLARHFSLSDPNRIEKVKGGEYTAFAEMQLRELFDVDLNNEENREQLEAQIDMDNYLLYYAIEILCGNTDWPNNSFEMWRYTGKKEDNNMYSDGRWRFLLYDVDLSFPEEFMPDYFEGCKEEQFDVIMQGKNRAIDSSFVKVMQSVHYRDKFITLLCDLLNTSFSYENIIRVINAENNKIKYAREDFYDKDTADKSELCVERMRQYALERFAKINECITRYFGYVDKYILNLDVPEGVEVYWNNMKFYGGENYSCEYYQGVQISLHQDTYPGYHFQYWLVNNRPVYSKTLFLTDSVADTGLVNVKPVMERDDESHLIISEIHSRGKEDWMKLTNTGVREVDISRFYLTDDSDNLQKYQLPKAVLKEGETVVIHGSKNREALGDYICNFSLSEHETLILSDESGICDQVYIPRMDRQESYGRYNGSNQWMFVGQQASPIG